MNSMFLRFHTLFHGQLILKMHQTTEIKLRLMTSFEIPKRRVVHYEFLLLDNEDKRHRSDQKTETLQAGEVS